MSRIGKLPIDIPDKVEVTISWNNIIVKWPLWELSSSYRDDQVEVEKQDNKILVKPKNDQSGAMWWTTRAFINNMVIWVTQSYKKSLEINGVWYKFELQWSSLILSIWYSHKVEVPFPSNLKVELDEKAKNILHISGIDKQLVWQFASKIRSKKKPEPYKWKGIKYVWEQIRRKAWKTWK